MTGWRRRTPDAAPADDSMRGRTTYVIPHLQVERNERIDSVQDLGEFYRQFGSRLPAAISAELATTARRLTT
jgi:GTP-dependent phosphoenolpyruvate carboxykinase